MNAVENVSVSESGHPKGSKHMQVMSVLIFQSRVTSPPCPTKSGVESVSTGTVSAHITSCFKTVEPNSPPIPFHASETIELSRQGTSLSTNSCYLATHEEVASVLPARLELLDGFLSTHAVSVPQEHTASPRSQLALASSH
jgi:hypothetical protein